MPKSVFTGSHKYLVETLLAARQRAGLTQVQLATKLGRDQSWVSLIEGSQRRVDVIEFVAISRALGCDPVDLFAEVARRLPPKLDI